MQCNTVDLVRALAASTGLRTVRLESVVLTPWERTMVLPTFQLLRTVEVSLPQWPAELAIDDVMDFVIALLPISSTLDVAIGQVLLPHHHLSRLLAGLQAREVSLSITAPSEFGGYPPMSVTLKLKSYDRDVPESRNFIVSSAQSCFALMETYSIFTQVCIIELEVTLLVQVLSALPPGLPALRRMTVRATWIEEVAHAFETSITSFPTRYFQCPELQRIDVGIESSATVKPYDETFARFISIFKGKEHVVVNLRSREVYYPSSDDDDDDYREWD
ncbi:hypothetical protein EXIGLDRAFT_820620 [Exidia glandulosa HHB12029]|uniref:Uncharacterized protein n=1 Tax=Exidia glandulosa HHB12029 TaxID=1314781 RepID=A0A166NLJ1_EXIGL|nr:hypothetical protein EXIGLDRAFT_820620 [Exidia glandulosa HHB12029]